VEGLFADSGQLLPVSRTVIWLTSGPGCRGRRFSTGQEKCRKRLRGPRRGWAMTRKNETPMPCWVPTNSRDIPTNGICHWCNGRGAGLPGGGRLGGSSSRVGVPAWIGPLSVAAHKNLGDTAGVVVAMATAGATGYSGFQRGARCRFIL
jgi:hypothetical protein